MAFRKRALEAIGGFDARFEAAGDDVDVCWRLQEVGEKLAFSAGAVVMHRRRDSVRRYLRQQYGYGRAEALLERKWPSRYNRVGSSRWSGRIYDPPGGDSPGRRALVRYGTWGSGLFQSVYDPAPGALASLLRAPEALLLIPLFGALAGLGLLWSPLLFALPLFLAAAGTLLWRAVANGWRAHPARPGRAAAETLRRRALTALLFALQPVARLAGRLRHGLSPWRRRRRPQASWPRPRVLTVWSERWRDPQERLQSLRDALAGDGGFVRSGGPFDRWDLDLRAAPLGGVKIRTAVEEHGAGRQLLRARIWPRVSAGGALVVTLLLLLSAYAWWDGQAGIALTLSAALGAVVAVGIEGTATAMSLALAVMRRAGEDELAALAEGDGAAAVREGKARAARPARDGAAPTAPGPVPSAPAPDGVVVSQIRAGAKKGHR